MTRIIIGILLLFLFTFIRVWPYTLIVLSVYWIIHLVRAKENPYQNLLLLTSALLICISIGEIACRIQGKHLSYSERSGASGSPYISMYKTEDTGWLHIIKPNISFARIKKEYNYPYHTNSLGLPDREYPTDKPRRCYRIAALGDSFTEGAGAAQDSTWPRFLQRMLHGTCADSFEVMGCGVSGSDPLFEYMLLRERLLAYHPDMVIVAINQSDVVDCMVRGGFERFRPDGTIQYTSGPWWEGIYAHSMLFRTVVHDLLGYDYLLMSPAEHEKRSAKAIAVLDQAVDSLSHLCQDHHCELVLAFHPFRPEVTEDHFEIGQVMDYARSKGLNTVNVRDSFMVPEVHDHIDRYFWPIDGHNTATGYQLFAHAIADQIRIPGCDSPPSGPDTDN